MPAPGRFPHMCIRFLRINPRTRRVPTRGEKVNRPNGAWRDADMAILLVVFLTVARRLGANFLIALAYTAVVPVVIAAVLSPITPFASSASAAPGRVRKGTPGFTPG